MESTTANRFGVINTFIAFIAFTLALVMAFKAVTAQPPWAGTAGHSAAGAGAADRIMTDEVQSIKVGKIAWGDPNPRGGLVERQAARGRAGRVLDRLLAVGRFAPPDAGKAALHRFLDRRASCRERV